MKILFAVHSYFPEQDGVTMVTRYLAEGLANRGHQIQIITEDKGRYKAFEQHKAVNIYRIKVHKQGNYFYGDREAYIRYIVGFAPDICVIVCTQTWAFDWLQNTLDSLPCKKVLFSHGYSGLKYSGIMDKYPLWEDLKKHQISRAMQHFYWKKYYMNAWKTMKKLDLLIYISEFGNDFEYGKKYSLWPYIVLGNAVEDVFFEERPSKQRRKFTFLNVANYNENKNQLRILNAFFKADIKDARLIFCGSKSNEYLEMLIRTRNELFGEDDRKVKFFSNLERKEVYNLYDNSDVFVLGSDWESFSLVLCEAGAKGLPAISTKVGCADILDGCLVVNSEDEMAEAMRSLYKDPNMRTQNGDKMKKYVSQHFRIEDKVHQIEEVFFKLCQ